MPTKSSCSKKEWSRKQGTHDELIDAGGVYAELYEVQFERNQATHGVLRLRHSC